MELLDHFSHNHPLTLLCRDHDEQVLLVFCSGCYLPLVSGNSTYSCSECEFFLHKSCAELPKEIINYLHPKHPLTLFARNPYGKWKRHCDDCGNKFTGFIYHCSLCNFDVNITCASQENIVPYEGHRHSFAPLRPTSFTCDACGNDRDGEFIQPILCTICKLQVHEECATLPLTIKQSRTHDHQLSLTYYSQLDDDCAADQICKICSQKINKEFWSYYCGGCSYICHVGCALSLEYDESQEKNQLLLPIPYSRKLGMITCVVKEINLKENPTFLTNQLEHFGLPHCFPLHLSNDELKGDEVCDGCALPILSPPFYSCAESNFFLHKACRELPYEILHPLHKHPLTLLAKVNNMHRTAVFRCSGCRIYGNGFAYACTKCDFYLDLICSSLSYTLKHEDCDYSGDPICVLGKNKFKFGKVYEDVEIHHHHLLTLVETKIREYPSCALCGDPCQDGALKCFECDFYFHTNACCEEDGLTLRSFASEWES